LVRTVAATNRFTDTTAHRGGTQMNDPTLQGTTTGRLARLDELDDYKVADGDPDVRGWDVQAADGRKVGKVDSLIVDAAAMQVRYLDVKLDKKALNLDEERHVLIPVGGARLDDDNDRVLLGTATAASLAELPPYTHGAIDRDYETNVRRGFDKSFTPPAGDQDFYGHAHYDQKGFFGRRREGREDAQYLTLAEERLAVGKRQVQAGEVEVRKTVETEHVRESVPVMHEEVSIERHPLSADAAGRHANATIEEDTIRVPLMAEEAVAEKRVVPTEEIVISKHAVRDEKTVEADLRKERLDVDREGRARGADRQP
jgi:uncharacterized protein (TIGR02271 family)